jgi:hypothetical protein
VDFLAVEEELGENRAHLLKLEGNVAALFLAGVSQYAEVRRPDLNPLRVSILLRPGWSHANAGNNGHNADTENFHEPAFLRDLSMLTPQKPVLFPMETGNTILLLMILRCWRII